VPSDFNVDGMTDLLWQNQLNGDLYVWYLDHDRVFDGGYPNPRGFASTEWQIRGLVDMNDDGHVDVYWQNVVTGALYVWFLNDRTVTGGSYLTPAYFYDTAWRAAGLGDFNGDGQEDILWRNEGTGGLYVWYMDKLVVVGGGYLSQVLPGATWQIRGVAGFDGDAKADILWHNQVNGQLYVWFMDGTTFKGASYLNPSALTDTAWRIVRAADFDGDGKTDLLWHAQSTGDLYVWYMNGVNIVTGGYLDPAKFADTAWAVVPK
jgi:hypothetical protein